MSLKDARGTATVSKKILILASSENDTQQLDQWVVGLSTKKNNTPHHPALVKIMYKDRVNSQYKIYT
jgi:hypothetical protein